MSLDKNQETMRQPKPATVRHSAIAEAFAHVAPKPLPTAPAASDPLVAMIATPDAR